MKSVLINALVLTLALVAAAINNSFIAEVYAAQHLSPANAINAALIIASILSLLVAVLASRKPAIESSAEDETDQHQLLKEQLAGAEQKIIALEQKAKLPPKSEYTDATVLLFLAQLQERGRLIDFAMEDISQQSDERVGVVARIVHQGVREVLKSCFAVMPLHEAREGETVEIGADYDGSSFRLIGANNLQPNTQGVLMHRGWKASAINISRVTELEQANTEVISPAEIRVS